MRSVASMSITPQLVKVIVLGEDLLRDVILEISRDRSLPIVAFWSADVSVCADRESAYLSSFASRLLDVAKLSSVFRLHSQRRQLTIVRDLKSASFTVTDALRYSLIMAFSKKLPGRAISSPF